MGLRHIHNKLNGSASTTTSAFAPLVEYATKRIISKP